MTLSSKGLPDGVTAGIARTHVVLYVTERCVFRLGEKGLVLTDVARGIDVQKDILDLLPFAVEVAEDLKVY